MRTYNLNLPANTERRHALTGRYFRIMDATGTVFMRIDNGPLLELAQGIGGRIDTGFKSLTFMSVAAQDVVVAVSQFPIDDSRLSLSAPIDIVNGATINNTAVSVGTAEVALAAAEPTRKSIAIFNNSTTATLYVGTTGLTTVNGWPIPPMSSYEFTKSAAAAFFGRASAAATNTRVIEELS